MATGTDVNDMIIINGFRDLPELERRNPNIRAGLRSCRVHLKQIHGVPNIDL
jgi:hypothetical protein